MTDHDATTEAAPAEKPAKLDRRAWWVASKRTVREFREDGLMDWAAALTYYGVLSLFPGLLALVSLLSLTGRPIVQPLIDSAGRLAPGPVRDILTAGLQNLRDNQAGGWFAVLSIAIALWLASRYVAAFMRAANAVYKMPAGRRLWRKLSVRVALTVVLLILLATIALGVVLTGALADWAAQLLGLGNTTVVVWEVAKWPVLVLLVALILAMLYWAAPNVRQARFRWITPGSLLAVSLWIISSVALAWYVASFGSYNQTYGALGGIIVFLVWLWIANMAVLLGLEFDAEVHRARAVKAGLPPDQEPYLRPRDASNVDDDRPHE